MLERFATLFSGSLPRETHIVYVKGINAENYNKMFTFYKNNIVTNAYII